MASKRGGFAAKTSKVKHGGRYLFPSIHSGFDFEPEPNIHTHTLTHGRLLSAYQIQAIPRRALSILALLLQWWVTLKCLLLWEPTTLHTHWHTQTHADMDTHTHTHTHSLGVHFLKLSLKLFFSAPGLVALVSRKESFAAGRETHGEGTCLHLHTETSITLWQIRTDI